MTFEPSTGSHGVDSLTLSAADSPAKALASPGQEPDLTTRKADCGQSKHASLARFDPITLEWKTHQRSLLAGDYELLESLPKWGMTVGGELWELPTPSGLTAHRAWIMSVLESGSLVRVETPTSGDTSNRKPSGTFTTTSTGRARHVAPNGVQSQERLSQQVKRLPTPTVDGNNNRKGASKTSGDGLATVVKSMRVPTPMASNANGSGLHGTGGLNLQTKVKLMASERVPTPTTQDAKNNGSASQLKRDALNATVGGPLNPPWVEWLMGWPIGWTALEPLGMDKWRQWLSCHGKL